MNNLIQRLSELKDEEIIADIDLEFCRFLQELDPHIHNDVLAASSLCSHAYRQGNVCISLQEHAQKPLFEDSDISAPPLGQWIKNLTESSVVGQPGTFKPLILDPSDRLYLHKLWHYEQTLAKNILSKVQVKPEDIDSEILRDGIRRLFNNENEGEEINWQMIAAFAAVYNKLTVISGGPGTGKTTTVVRVLALILEQSLKENHMPAIALAAPTGKAAARLEDSILSSKEGLETSEEIKEALPDKAVTLHQLLGARRSSSQFRYNEENPLPYDVVVVDEASMVDQALMSRLIASLLHDTKLILIGDKDQLASVEAGSVLGSICAVDQNNISQELADQLQTYSVDLPLSVIEKTKSPLTDNIVLLEKNYRFAEDSGIPRLADSINRGEVQEALRLLEEKKTEDIAFTEFLSYEDFDRQLREIVLTYFRPVLLSDKPEKMFEALKQIRVLSPHRRGPLGVEYLNKQIEDLLIAEGLITRYETWYHGKPVIINQNDYGLGLNNGDIGICVQAKEGEKQIYFQLEDGFRRLAPSRLPDYGTAYALTVHKSQGSEFNNVFLVLPNKVSKVLTRELLYTAITRARKSVTIIGKQEILAEGIKTKLRRSSGLKDLLWKV